MNSASQNRTVYAVSELAGTLRRLVAEALPAVWVTGEVSNFRNPSGHWYFVLKDASAQLRCALFKNRNKGLPMPRDGDHVLLRAKLDFYETRGELQLIVEHLEPAGEGALLRAFEQLKAKLAAEGLFDEALKRPLPTAPRGIGVITGATTAALQDILSTLRRRYPLGAVHLWPVPVQGDTAPPAIARALAELPARAPVDVVILARGGGSIEDLWCFNDERIARAIRVCAVPVVTGIGHEIDFTIADFAADLRAPTPTGAAERVAPDVAEWRARLDGLGRELAAALRGQLDDLRAALEQRLARLDRAHPGRQLLRIHQRLDELQDRMRLGLRRTLAERETRLRGLEGLLRSLGPDAVLARGYAIVQDADGAVVRDAGALAEGDALEIALARGRVGARVTRP